METWIIAEILPTGWKKYHEGRSALDVQILIEHIEEKRHAWEHVGPTKKITKGAK